jgi:hypothetical protein
MKTLLITLLLSSLLFAELYECKNAFLSVQSNSITVVTEDGETFHARRGYGAFCYDFQDEEKQVSICLQKNGDTFTWTTSEGERTEKCVRVD